MPKNKLKLAFIPDDSARKTSFKKRNESLKKKMNELTTLCGVDACAIIYHPNQSKPEVWPSKNGVEDVLNQYHETPQMEVSKKKYNPDTFIEHRMTKAADQLNKHNKENREKVVANKVSELFNREISIYNLNINDLHDIVSLADKKVEDINKTLELIKGAPAATLPPPPPPQPQPPVVCYTNTDNYYTVAGGAVGDGFVPVVENHGTLNNIQTADQWFPNWTENMNMGEQYYLGDAGYGYDPMNNWHFK